MDRTAPGRDLLLLPSYSADPRTIASIAGIVSWPERHLIELRHLSQAGNRVVLITPVAISDACLDAVLELIPAAPAAWLRQRLRCICLDDDSPRSLSEKVLERPQLMERLAGMLRPGALLSAVAVGPAEMVLAERLGLDLEGSPALLAPLGSKAGSAAVFAALGFPHPRSTPCCHSLEQLTLATEALLLADPAISAVVVKLNCMAGGRGNAPLPLDPAAWRLQTPRRRRESLRRALERLAMPLAHWRDELQRSGAIAQELIGCAPGALSSPSVQLWIDGDGHSRVVSTHEQLLGGPHHQSFTGCRCPARQAYRGELMTMGERLGRHLAGLGCRGPVLLDLLAQRGQGGWRLWAMEINLRKGGTTHPFQLASTACAASLDRGSGVLRSGDGRTIVYEASDGLALPRWRGRQPEQLVDALVRQGLYFNAARLNGCIPHRLGALQQHGLLGVTAVAGSRVQAHRLMRQLLSLAGGCSDAAPPPAPAPDRSGPAWR